MYSTTLKAPNSKICMDNNNIDDWLHNNIMMNYNWTGELFYNDEPPNAPTTFTGGHCKGVLVWNDKFLGWLIHSVPKWPETLLNPIPHAECEYGQSFVWTILPIEKLQIILKQIQLMHSHVYHDPNNIFIPLKYSPNVLINMVQLDTNIYHIAKHNNWGKDLFEDGLVVDFPGSKWMSETWGRPLQAATVNVGRIKEIHWDNCTYTEHQDHSKFAISDKKICAVWIGDINAMTSQFHRGGGGLIIKNDLDLWNKFNNIII
jgi:hypothetical protein